MTGNHTTPRLNFSPIEDRQSLEYGTSFTSLHGGGWWGAGIFEYKGKSGSRLVLPQRQVLNPYCTFTYWLGWDRGGAACFACPGVCGGYILKGLPVSCLNPYTTCLQEWRGRMHVVGERPDYRHSPYHFPGCGKAGACCFLEG